jgi:hypothetical protein
LTDKAKDQTETSLNAKVGDDIAVFDIKVDNTNIWGKPILMTVKEQLKAVRLYS